MMFCLAINNKNFDDEKVTQPGMMQLIHTPKMPQRAPNPHNWPVSKQSAYFPGYYFAKHDRKGRDIAKSWRRAAESIDAKVH